MTTNGHTLAQGKGHRDVEYSSEVIQPGGEAWVIIGRPEGLIPLKLDANVASLAAFDILAIGDLTDADAVVRTGGKFKKAGWIRVKNRSRQPTSFGFVVRFVADTTKIELDVGRAVEAAWREGTTRKPGS
jgi:hypothetical protein